MTDNLIAIADSLGWALLHSIWQVSLIAAIVFVSLRLISRANPQLRFAAAYFGMVASAIAFIVTFIAYFSWWASPPASMAAVAVQPATGWAAYIEMLGSMTWLVSLCWGFGFIALAARYIRALRATQMLRHSGVSAVPEEWESRFRLWLERLGADQRTAILYSELISTPVTIGTFKPLILLPAGFFLRLPSEQAEAVLIHEIAHVCRQDYLLGLIQAMISNIFFFHPGIYFLSRQVDVEREYACDARAAEETGDATALAKGLSQIALESQVPLPGFAMAASGKRTPLMDRINRLADRPSRREAGMGTPAAALTMVFAASLMIAISADAAPTDTGNAEAKAPEPIVPEAEGERAAEIVITEDGIEIADNSVGTIPGVETESITVRMNGANALAEPRRAHKPHRHPRRAAATPPAPVTPVRPAMWQVSHLNNEGKSPVSLFRSAVFTPPIPPSPPQVSGHDQHECEDEGERRRERAERIAERAERHAEQHAARAERLAERHAARAERIAERHAARAAQHAERIAEHHARKAERDAERMAERAERHAERIARNSERLQGHMERLQDEVERRSERIEREVEQRERERQRQRTRANSITISFAVIPEGTDG